MHKVHFECDLSWTHPDAPSTHKRFINEIVRAFRPEDHAHELWVYGNVAVPSDDGSVEVVFGVRGDVIVVAEIRYPNARA